MLLQGRIHKWSTTLPDWQRDLLRRLTEGPLAPEDQAEVLSVLVGEEGAPEPVPLELAHLPADEDEQGPVELTAIKDLENVNLLAGGQSLQFSPGLNVVFGLTGAGKSGYGRLLRRLCRAAHRGEVLRDAFDPGAATGAQTAKLEVTVGGAARDIAVDLAEDPERLLSQITVFDSDCANVFLSGPNTIEHVPRPMLLLRYLVEAQDAVGELISERIQSLNAQIPALPEVPPETQAGQVLAVLEADTDLSAVKQFAELTAEEQEELRQLDVAAATIASDQSRQVEAAARGRARAAQRTLEALAEAAGLLDDESVTAIREMYSRLVTATKAERELTDKTFAGQRFPLTGESAWQEMWEAARRFVELGGGTFPDTGPDGACPTCQQPLEEGARARMRSFEEFVRSDLSQRVSGFRSDLKAKVDALPNIADVHSRVEAFLDGLPDEITGVVFRALDHLSAREQAARKFAVGETVEEMPGPLIETKKIADYAKEQNSDADAQAGLRDEEEQRRILARRAELQARKATTAALTEIEARIATLRDIAALEAAKSKLATRKISAQLRDLQQAVITDRLHKAVTDELEELHPVAGRIKVDGRASKGETVIRLRLSEPCRDKIGDVLSEGEQRALALSFFLADVAVAEGRSAVIFDDPVSSLDHERRTYVARRLVEEAEKRQVIVFTHDFTFVYLLQEAAEQAGRELSGQTLQRANHQVGVVSDELPTKAMSPSKRRKNLRHRLKAELSPMFKRQDPAYERESDIWTTDLRKAYDQLIEDYVLAGTVRRWHSQVRIRQLRQIKWSMDVVERIEAGMRKANNKTHHEAAELQPTPFTPDELSVMLDDFEEVSDLTHPGGAKEEEPDVPAAESTTTRADGINESPDGTLAQAS